MGAMIEPRLDRPKPAILAELHELQLARTALQRERTAAQNRADRLTLALLRRQHASRLRQIERALDEIDAAVAALVAADPDLARKAEILCSIPGVAMVTAAAILAELPELGSLEAAAAAISPGSRRSPANPAGGRARRRSAAGAATCAGRSTFLPSRPRATIRTSRPSTTASAPEASPPSSPSSR